MRILVLNWQDFTNPQAGGAELHLQEIFSRIVDSGHRVDLLCSSWKNAPERANLGGIEVYRTGSRHTYPFVAHRYYRRHLAANEYDVVIEDLNKVPLYTPLWSLRKLVALVHHLFGGTVFREATPPVAAAVWLSERPLGALYRHIPFQAVSLSTADDLVARGIARQAIRVIYNGVDSERLTPNPAERSEQPLFVYLGRLKKYKRVDAVIRAFAGLNLPEARLDIAGTGDYRAALEGLVKSLDLAERVRFLGFIPEEEKVHLLRRAWASVLASPKEGWGISNLEAAACGTPVIAANSPGIRESVIDGATGFLVPQDDPDAMAAAMRGIVQSPDLVETLGRAARKFAETFSWDRAANETLSHLEWVVAQ
ncbi:MAG TPA: glycosyltransferase family 4 protein [Gemmatimonadaceae bacterium]|nr:glycosyltransferase family 4 protein [Gemmatimonadaceae bacterium]HZF73532.1 glycosyltransferase family 4 protein [Gemmatimonadaceae bacterium]